MAMRGLRSHRTYLIDLFPQDEWDVRVLEYPGYGARSGVRPSLLSPRGNGGDSGLARGSGRAAADSWSVNHWFGGGRAGGGRSAGLGWGLLSLRPSPSLPMLPGRTTNSSGASSSGVIF